MVRLKIGDVFNISGDKGVYLGTSKSGLDMHKMVVMIKDQYTDDISYSDNVQKVKEAPYKVVSAQRKNIDGDNDYKFYLARKGRKTIVAAGCRFFSSLKDARAHWSKPVAKDLLGFDVEFFRENRKYKNEQSLLILDRLEKRMKKLEA